MPSAVRIEEHEHRFADAPRRVARGVEAVDRCARDAGRVRTRSASANRRAAQAVEHRVRDLHRVRTACLRRPAPDRRRTPLWICRLHALDRIQHDRDLFGCRPDSPSAPRRSRRSTPSAAKPSNNDGQCLRGDRSATRRAVIGAAAQQCRRRLQNPHAEPLHRECRDRIADARADHLALDRQNRLHAAREPSDRWRMVACVAPTSKR